MHRGKMRKKSKFDQTLFRLVQPPPILQFPSNKYIQFSMTIPFEERPSEPINQITDSKREIETNILRDDYPNSSNVQLVNFKLSLGNFMPNASSSPKSSSITQWKCAKKVSAIRHRNATHFPISMPLYFSPFGDFIPFGTQFCNDWDQTGGCHTC